MKSKNTKVIKNELFKFLLVFPITLLKMLLKQIESLTHFLVNMEMFARRQKNTFLVKLHNAQKIHAMGVPTLN